jgi:hypothetical protein
MRKECPHVHRPGSSPAGIRRGKKIFVTARRRAAMRLRGWRGAAWRAHLAASSASSQARQAGHGVYANGNQLPSQSIWGVGFGRIVVSGTPVPNMLANLV